MYYLNEPLNIDEHSKEPGTLSSKLHSTNNVTLSKTFFTLIMKIDCQTSSL